MYTVSKNEFLVNESIAFNIIPDDNTTQLDLGGTIINLTEGAFPIVMNPIAEPNTYNLTFTKVDGDNVGETFDVGLIITEPVVEEVQEEEEVRTTNESTVIPDDLDNKFLGSENVDEVKDFRTPHTSENSRNAGELQSHSPFPRMESREDKFPYGDRVKAMPNNLKLGTGLGVNDTSGAPNSADDKSQTVTRNTIDSGTWAVTI